MSSAQIGASTKPDFVLKMAFYCGELYVIVSIGEAYQENPIDIDLDTFPEFDSL